MIFMQPSSLREKTSLWCPCQDEDAVGVVVCYECPPDWIGLPGGAEGVQQERPRVNPPRRLLAQGSEVRHSIVFHLNLMIRTYI
jgi:hypothetical protein